MSKNSNIQDLNRIFGFFLKDGFSSIEERLQHILDEQPDLASFAFELAKPGFKHSDLEIREVTIDLVGVMVRANPADLAYDAFDLSKISLQDHRKKAHQIRSNAARLMELAVKADPSLAAEAFELLENCLKNDPRGDVRYPALSAIASVVKANPTFAGPAFELVKQGANDKYYMVQFSALEVIPAIVETDPSFARDCLEVFNIASKDSFYGVRLKVAENVPAIAKADPAFVRESFTLLKNLSEETVDDCSNTIRHQAKNSLKAILEVKPALAVDVLALVKDADDVFLFPAILKADPSLAPKCLSLLKTFAENPEDISEQHSKKSCAISWLGKIVEAQPELASEIFKMAQIAVKDDDHRVRIDGLKALPAIVKVNHDLANDAFNIAEAAAGTIAACLSDDNAQATAGSTTEILSDDWLCRQYRWVGQCITEITDRIRMAALEAIPPIIESNPDFAQRSLKTVKAAIDYKYTDKETASSALKVIPAIVKADPSLKDKALEVLRPFTQDPKTEMNEEIASIYKECMLAGRKARRPETRSPKSRAQTHTAG